jgi:hypothetical protein
MAAVKSERRCQERRSFDRETNQERLSALVGDAPATAPSSPVVEAFFARKQPGEFKWHVKGNDWTTQVTFSSFGKNMTSAQVRAAIKHRDQPGPKKGLWVLNCDYAGTPAYYSVRQALSDPAGSTVSILQEHKTEYQEVIVETDSVVPLCALPNALRVKLGCLTPEEVAGEERQKEQERAQRKLKTDKEWEQARVTPNAGLGLTLCTV